MKILQWIYTYHFTTIYLEIHSWIILKKGCRAIHKTQYDWLPKNAKFTIRSRQSLTGAQRQRFNDPIIAAKYVNSKIKWNIFCLHSCFSPKHWQQKHIILNAFKLVEINAWQMLMVLDIEAQDLYLKTHSSCDSVDHICKTGMITIAIGNYVTFQFYLKNEWQQLFHFLFKIFYG